MPQLLAIAEYITKTLAICVVCGGPANRTQRVAGGKERIVVGAKGLYEARCRNCFVQPEEEEEGQPEDAPAGSAAAPGPGARGA